MKLPQKIVSGVTAVALMLGMAVGIAPSAKAAPSCFTDRVCIWDGANYSGSVTSRTVGLWWCVTYPSTWVNKATSIYNNTEFFIKWYDGDTCTGRHLYTTFPGELVPQLPGTANNMINSFWVWF